MMNETNSHFRDELKDILEGKTLRDPQIEHVLTTMVRHPFDEVTAAALLTAWRMRGETGPEIAAAVRTLQAFQKTLHTGSEPVLDTCGTGGDESGTFNISTAVSFVVAGCGIRVVKHGNRAVSSKSGSADVLQELGVPIYQTIESVERVFHQVGYAFCFAPIFHPALAQVAPLRKKLGVRTVFNLLGPLLNPAGAKFHLLGVGIPNMLDTLADALHNLRCERAILVSGRDRFDEVSLSGITDVRIVSNKKIERHEWTAESFELEPVQLSEIQAHSAFESAGIIQRVLSGETGPATRIVLANAAAALLTIGAVDSLVEGVAMAEKSIRQGKAQHVLNVLQASATGLTS